MPIRAPVERTTSSTTSATWLGQHAAVGVAQGDDLGAGLGGDPHGLERVVAVGGVAVEEVLGVEEDPPALAAQERHGVADHLEVLGQRGAQRPLDVAGVRLGDEGDDLGLAVEQRPHLRVALGPAAGPPGRAEGRQGGVAQPQVGRGAGEELGVLGVGAGPAALDEADPQLVEVRRDGELVRHGEVEALLLRAVAQRRVVDVDVGHRCSPGSVCRSPGVCAPARAGRGGTCVVLRPFSGRRCCRAARGVGGCDTCSPVTPRPRRSRQAKDPPGAGGLRDEEVSSR